LQWGIITTVDEDLEVLGHIDYNWSGIGFEVIYFWLGNIVR
jgi:hypothetical protein